LEKPILFSTEMVRAILEGRKTQTRRIVKPQPPSFAGLKMYGEKPSCFYCWEGNMTEVKMPYQPGDVLYVRETWCFWPHYDCESENCGKSCIVHKDELGCFLYRATTNPIIDSEFVWKPSIHMPREAARLFLQVKAVRVERLQEITEGDAEQEGCYCIYEASIPYQRLIGQSFEAIWDSIYAKRGHGWDANPWVFVIEFERQ
jgi:hypothetical protein